MSGPLHGLRVVELMGAGPGPFGAMLLADLGADVLMIERREPTDLGVRRLGDSIIVRRGRRSLQLDLKQPDDIRRLLAIVARADVLIEGMRPGVAERLGVGPQACAAVNPRLVYARATGWGQDGPLADAVGHDIDYIAITGALASIRARADPLAIPLNLIGDFGGGGLLMAFGIVCAVHEARTSGRGQVVDAAMVDGANTLMGVFHGLMAGGLWNDDRGSNLLDGGAPWYGVYECADGRHLAAGPIEDRFYEAFVARLGLDATVLPDRHDRRQWPALRAVFEAVIRTRTRDEWAQRFADSDACVAPVLALSEVRTHPHQVARGSFTEIDGVPQPIPSPRFSRTPGAIRCAPPQPGEGGEQALADWGVVF